MTETIVISGGLIADGTGGPLRREDIAIADGRIKAIGDDLSGDIMLDARGAVVAPGFIDIHTHYDAQLFWDPACTPSIWHGVTSVILANCGFGLAPCRADNREILMQMLVDLEDMPLPVLKAGIDWSFSDFGEYLRQIEALRPSVNVASYIGHSPVRIEVMGLHAYERAATDEEIDRMAEIVAGAMAEGAVGFASNSAPTGRRSATGPADERELMALAKAMAAEGRGVLALVPGGRNLSSERMYAVQRAAGRPLTWTALLALADGRHRDWAATHISHYEAGAPVHPQVSCLPNGARTTLRSAFALRVPSMLALEGKPEEARIAAFRDPAWREKVTAEWAAYPHSVSWDQWSVSETGSDPDAIGLTVAEYARRRGVAPLDAVFDLALNDGLSTRFHVVQTNYDETEVATLLNLEGVVLGLADSGAHPDQICDAVLPTALLGGWVRDRGTLSLEQAVRKLTGEAADLFGLDRGYLKVGAPADVTVFDPDTIAPGPLRRVRDMPAGGERLIADETVGLRHMLVNGTIVRRDGQPLERGPDGGAGRVLRPA